MQKAIGLKKIFIGIEENKPDAIEHLTELAKSYSDIEIVPLKLKYPQGGEKQLIESITGKQVPSGKLPSDIGVIVQNISTVFAIYQAIQKNRPLIDRVVTITGKRLPHTGNFLVRL
jgi:electron transport complex protein RnfC